MRLFDCGKHAQSEISIENYFHGVLPFAKRINHLVVYDVEENIISCKLFAK